MKSFFAILAAAAMATVANAAACDLTIVAPLLQDVDVKQCTADSGFQAPIPPTADQLPKVCASKACMAALGKLKALKLGDCMVGSIGLETGLIGPIDKACSGSSGATTPAPAAGAGNNTSSPTPTPGSGSLPGAVEPNTTAPATKAPTTAATTAPTPEPTSAAFAPSQASNVLLGSSLVAVVYMAAN